MIESVDARVLVSHHDLLTDARLIEARAGDPESELERLLIVRRFIAASFELTRSLQAYTECALVNHCGTTGTRSLAEATEVLFAALSDYGMRCREVAMEARRSGYEDGSSWEEDRVAVCGAAR